MIYDAEMQWLEAKQGAKDSAFVTTTFDLANGETEKAVQFEQVFPKGSDVQVVGWIQSFRISTEKDEDYACDFWATKVNSKGFTAHAECGGNTERLTVTFIALKKGKDKVAAGSFSTEKDGEEGENSQEMKGAYCSGGIKPVRTGRWEGHEDRCRGGGCFGRWLLMGNT
jgi:hypothetical protein